MIDLGVEERNGMIVIYALVATPIMEVSAPVLVFSDIDKFKAFVDMLSKFRNEKSTPIPDYIERAFKGDNNASSHQKG